MKKYGKLYAQVRNKFLLASKMVWFVYKYRVLARMETGEHLKANEFNWDKRAERVRRQCKGLVKKIVVKGEVFYVPADKSLTPRQARAKWKELTQ